LSAGERPSESDSPDDGAPKLELVRGPSRSEFTNNGAWAENCRRNAGERRTNPTRAWHSLFGFHRRRDGRRRGEIANSYVDRYSPQDLALLLGVFILNILDAFFTLRWLDMGGGEANPIMKALIDSSDMLFLMQKCMVVGLWLVILVIHKNFRIARIGLWGALVLYTCILLYHFVLQTGAQLPIPPPGTASLP
jgi:hypothetical protein